MFSKYTTSQSEKDKEQRHPLYVLAKIAQFLSIIGVGMVVFGTFFSRVFIRIVYTEKWATDVRIYSILSHCIVCL
jgi:O-antigen/teichoic acid export membrane protein